MKFKVLWQAGRIRPFFDWRWGYYRAGNIKKWALGPIIVFHLRRP